ncbi:hypothetical protein [Ralstonia pseudosolanacearum]|uniref:hypothetical protein n=1 Tax=Ralstonia pseudosolanacearum TaxID=1310165 RepID=UPI003D011F49
MQDALLFVVQYVPIRTVRNNYRGNMSILSDLISLKGLVTVTATFALTIKSLRLSWSVNKKNVSVNGNNNAVSVVYNEALAPAQKSFRYLWNLLAIAVFLAYPLAGAAFNSSIRILACIGVPIAVGAVIVHCMRFGFGRRLWDLFYVIGAGIMCWLTWCATPFLEYTASQTASLYRNIHAAIGLSSGGASLLDLSYVITKTIGYPLISVIGFSMLFLSVLYLVFAFLTERTFDGALKFSVSQVGMGALGYILACNLFVAMFLQNFAYIKAVLLTPIEPFLS